ncbi:unnamed protein product [Taenia asiatica]|uniref:Delta-like protein n=1 Tax=Taenia asiatica TaxID=60517 RepID=A0A158R8C4_TAEAS|nr:unnamed protein product [Taenia asiatica]
MGDRQLLQKNDADDDHELRPFPKRQMTLYTMILEVFDAKSDGMSTSTYLVDRTFHRNILLPSTPSQWQSIVVESTSSTYRLSMRLVCTPHHFGLKCAVGCQPQAGQYTCDRHGNRVCEKGWSGENCDRRKNTLAVHCVNGWKGELCDECITYPGCQHGTCDNAPFTCHCLPNWGGAFCDQDLDYCGRHKPCLNGGICKNTNITSQPFHCICPRGWKGETCEKNIDFCEQNLCMNGGRCQDLDGLGFRCDCPRGFQGSVCQLRSPCIDSQCVHAHKCTQLATASHGGIKHDCLCLPGWTGELCDQNINDCVDKCLNGGTCHDLIGDYYCTCPEGFSGRNCEVNRKCASNPCKNKGVCVEIEGGFQCVCPEGVTGTLCEFARRGCDPNPCENHAPCYNLSPYDYYCKCNEGFYGRRCEHRRPYCGPEGCSSLLDPCADTKSPLQIPLLPAVTFNAQSPAVSTDSCGEHGICLQDPVTSQHSCVCENGYAGRFCQQLKDNCAEMGHLCRNGATCVNGEADAFYCLCAVGFTGTFCEQELQACDSEPCRNGAYCQQMEVTGDVSFQCRCTPGWSGRWCHLPTPRSPCQVSQPCHNGGVCLDDALSPHGFFCQCPSGWTGLFCQTRSPDYQACGNGNFCKNGGTCINVGEGFHCLCPPGFAGSRCEEDIDECRNNPCQNGGKCRDLVNGFECSCAEGFMGVDCRHNINECVNHPCAYGARCVDKIGTYECICPEGRGGRHCEEVIVPITPKPPSCRFNHRIFDHGEKWASHCATCECVEGNIVCKREFCGYWSCLTASGEDDPFACGDGEECHLLSTPPPPPLCLTPPCYARAHCVNTSMAEVSAMSPAPPGLPPALPGCRPASVRLTNQCARLAVVVSRSRLPYGVTVEDFCNAVRALPAVEQTRTASNEGGLLGMSCGLAGRQPDYPSDLAYIEVTLSSTDERIRKAEDGREFVFVQRFAHNIAAAIRENASTNITSQTRHLPSLALMVGADSQDYYWHTILHGVAEINVETVLVKDDEIPHNPLLVPLACCLVVAVGALCTCIICVCAHRKHQELIEKHAATTKQSPTASATAASTAPGATLTPQAATTHYYQSTVVFPTPGQQQQQQQQRSVR